MPSRDDWIIIGLVLGVVAVIGVTVWVLRKKASPQRLQLKRLSEPKVVMRNLEEREIIRDREGNLKKIVIHREVKRVY